jgi:hypothetical protein
MLVPTHVSIGKKLYRLLEKERRSKVSYLAFLYGNIKPDVRKSKYAFSHYRSESAAFIESEILALTHFEGSKWDFSIRLGVLCHFLSDTCCIYHSEETYIHRSLTDHLFYEFKLHHPIAKVDLKNMETTSVRLSEVKQLFDHIDATHDKHLSEWNGLQDDVHALFELTAPFFTSLCSLAESGDQFNLDTVLSYDSFISAKTDSGQFAASPLK